MRIQLHTLITVGAVQLITDRSGAGSEGGLRQALSVGGACSL
ncbi:hypothetical protein [Paenibacillus radicibacter]|nr:hypothetical protein [Paenibacillus radicibacter]